MNYNDMIITRFAPSPTGFLHIGGARTALFNFLYARHHGGKYYLRIEDTDKKRSTQEAIDAIINGLQLLGIFHDDAVIFQSHRIERHVEVANRLLENGGAYRCYCTQKEIQEEIQSRDGKYISPWRDAQDPGSGGFVVRMKVPLAGETRIYDKVFGEIVVQNAQLDDMVLLRSDGTPTYMLSVVVDDHDMGVTDVIRGVDHLTNASRQAMLYQLLGWKLPNFAHIPLIHDADGNKLSKRRNAVSVEDYLQDGYLPVALRNYLLRLGWSHGNDEFISDDDAIRWFALDNVSKSPARLDCKKLQHVNNYYMCRSDDLFALVSEVLNRDLDDYEADMVGWAIDIFKTRASTINELADLILFVFEVSYDEDAVAVLKIGVLSTILEDIKSIQNWDHEAISHALRAIGKSYGLKMKDIYQSLRAAVMGTMNSAGIVDVMLLLGRDVVLQRLEKARNDFQS